MLAKQRQAQLLERIGAIGAVRISDIAAELGVSEMTVRRDLRELAENGLVHKVHGGAVAIGRNAEEPGFHAKSGWHTGTKARIAAAAAALVAPGDCVAFSGGTTTFAVAQALGELAPLTVVTNSLAVAQLLPVHARQEVIVLGGVRTPSDALVGPVTLEALGHLRSDILIIGAHGFSVPGGLMSPNLLESETNRRLIAAAGRVVLVADSSKAHESAMSSFASLDQVDVLVTDDGLDAELLAELHEHIAEIVTVPHE